MNEEKKPQEIDLGAKPESPEELTKRERDEYKDKYLRLLAENENTRKRLVKEKQEITKFAVQNVIVEFLHPLDNLENALKFTNTANHELKMWAKGFEMILGQFKEVLHNNGVHPFDCEGDRFDPHLHEAVETEETDEAPPGTILKEYIRGYRQDGRTIRPARVKVAEAHKIHDKQEEGEEYDQEKE